MSIPDFTIGIVGAGKVGETLGRLFHTRGLIVYAIYNRHPEKAQRVARVIGAEVVDSPADVVNSCDLIIVSVSDDAIASVVETIARRGGTWDGKAVVHTSGVHGMEILSPLVPFGMMIGGFHPAYAIANADATVQRMLQENVTFAIETSHPVLRDWLATLIDVLHGQIIEISPGGKPLYHAALSIASNYTVTLYAAAAHLLNRMGADDTAVQAVLNPLLEGSIKNITNVGASDSLTGPLVRGDVGTVTAHIQALKSFDPALCKTYIALARQTYPLLVVRGVDTEPFERVFANFEKKEN